MLSAARPAVEKAGLEPSGFNAAARRVSWAAIFAGVVIALVVELLFSLLGVGIGASTIDPLQDQSPMRGIGTGAGIWFTISTLLALFAGGWTAARLSGVRLTLDSVLHGVITWGLTTLLTVYLVTSAAGGLLGGVTSVIGQGASLLGRGAAAASPAITDAISNQLKQQGIDWSGLKQEADLLLRQTGKSELRPEALGRQAKQVGREAKSSAGDAARNPNNADDDFSSLFKRILDKGSATFEAADRQALVNVLMARTNMDRRQANDTVDRWQETYQKTLQRYEATKQQAKQKALELADATARNVSRAALWSFVGLLFGSCAAGYGGFLGNNTRALAIETR